MRILFVNDCGKQCPPEHNSLCRYFRPSQHAEHDGELLQGNRTTTSTIAEHLHAAEHHGLNEGDCDLIYRCRRSPLDHLTVLEEHKGDVALDCGEINGKL